MKSKLKMTLGIVAIIVILIITGIALFLNLSPQFGASKRAIQTPKIVQSPNFADGKFHNLTETTVMTGFKISSLPEYFTNGNKVPDFEIPVNSIDVNQLNQIPDSLFRVTWFGHSTVLIESGKKLILIDPMFGNVPSPVSWGGSPRFNKELPLELENFPFVDIVLITHDHYDHLDYGSIKKLRGKVGKFFVPLGVGAHLRTWDVEPDKVVEMDWWDMETIGEIGLVATPARHFSGRGMFDRNTTLWCSWVIQTPAGNIFFSGDGGYGDHFKEIGNKLGPFDFAMMECGQYNEQWAQIHMMPEEIPLALADLKTKTFMPIHWGAFKLALHPWTEPVDQLQKILRDKPVTMILPEVGQGFYPGEKMPDNKWWLGEK